MAYIRLVEIDGIPTMKESSSKVSYPGRKQIFRRQDSQIHGDRLGLADESPRSEEQPVLQRVMQQGKRLQSPEPLEAIKQRTAATVASLPAPTRQLNNPSTISVEVSDALKSLRQSVTANHQSSVHK